jgi:hypothetical protein
MCCEWIAAIARRPGHANVLLDGERALIDQATWVYAGMARG